MNLGLEPDLESVFERAWILRGMENLMLDMVSDPNFVETLLDRIVKFNFSIINQTVGFPIQMIYFGDEASKGVC